MQQPHPHPLFRLTLEGYAYISGTLALSMDLSICIQPTIRCLGVLLPELEAFLARIRLAEIAITKSADASVACSYITVSVDLTFRLSIPVNQLPS